MDELGSGIDDLAHAVIGAAIEVHPALGPGHIEAFYRRAMCIELAIRNIDYSVRTPGGP